MQKHSYQVSGMGWAVEHFESDFWKLIGMSLHTPVYDLEVRPFAASSSDAAPSRLVTIKGAQKWGKWAQHIVVAEGKNVVVKSHTERLSDRLLKPAFLQAGRRLGLLSR